jgi:hypothetical protein
MIRHGGLAERSQERSRLTAFLSDDEGQTWQGGLVLDERLDAASPDAAQSPDGRLHVLYDLPRWGQQQVLMAAITEQEIESRETFYRESRLRMPVP